ncbi:MAG: hypothetical protein E7588_02155 [Ruminococcaceae bacterium]|nr:hypothetical protein [Oscillospiraceae bacterium]
MKKYIPIALLVLTCLFSIISLFHVSELNDEVKNLKTAYNNSINDISRSINNIHSSIDNKLEQQANLLSSTESEYIKPDIPNKTVVLRYSVLPKQFAPDTTAVCVICNDTPYPMTYENGKYIADITLPLFEESQITAVQLDDNGTIRTQSVRDYYSPKYDFIPSVYAHYIGNSRGVYANEVYQKKYNGDIEIRLESKGREVKAEKIMLLEYINGELIATTEIPENHKRTLSTSGSTIHATQEAAVPVDGYKATDPYYYFYDKTAAIPYDSIYELYVEVVDTYGLRHRVLVDIEKIDKNGRNVDLIMYHGMEGTIYDMQGNLLCAPGVSVTIGGSDYEVRQKIETASGK